MNQAQRQVSGIDEDIIRSLSPEDRRKTLATAQFEVTLAKGILQFKQCSGGDTAYVNSVCKQIGMALAAGPAVEEAAAELPRNEAVVAAPQQ